MKLLSDYKGEKIIRILIGNAQQGKSGIEKPIKVISIVKTNVEEVHRMILDLINEKSKKIVIKKEVKKNVK